MRLVRVAVPFGLARYLAGREYDDRVKYATWVNLSKKYPYASKRQNSRFNTFERLKARGLIQEVTHDTANA